VLAGKHDRLFARIAGATVAALLLWAMSVGVSELVMIWCPRHGDCETTSQVLFWSGMLVSAVIAGGAGLTAIDLLDRKLAHRAPPHTPDPS
jgi:hypothetical protein